MCGIGRLHPKVQSERFPYEDDGAEVMVVAEDVPVESCDNPKCAEEFSGPVAASIRHHAICRALGLLTPAEIRAIRERLGMTQEQFTKLTRIGEATICRWERGRLLQNPAMDRYLRLVALSEDNVRFLKGLEKDGPLTAPAAPRQEAGRPVADHHAFTIGLWHRFGPHGRETPEQIIERKRKEIVANGWTLWSFQYRRPQVLESWAREILAAGPSRVFVYCSDSPRAVDPADAGVPVPTPDCRSYWFAGQDEWQPWPAGVRVPHPFRGSRRQASAFVVQRIIYPVEPFARPAVEWLFGRQWRQDRLPTRGEYLIRAGGKTSMPPVRAILELRAPYLALVSMDDAESLRRRTRTVHPSQ